MFDDGSLIQGLWTTHISDPEMPSVIREQAESVLAPYEEGEERISRTTHLPVATLAGPFVTVTRYGDCVAWSVTP